MRPTELRVYMRGIRSCAALDYAMKKFPKKCGCVGAVLYTTLD